MSLAWKELRRVDRAAVFKKRAYAAELRREPHGVTVSPVGSSPLSSSTTTHISPLAARR